MLLQIYAGDDPAKLNIVLKMNFFEIRCALRTRCRRLKAVRAFYAYCFLYEPYLRVKGIRVPY